MDKAKALQARRKQRVRTRIRRRINDRPRLSVFRSGKNIFAEKYQDNGAGFVEAVFPDGQKFVTDALIDNLLLDASGVGVNVEIVDPSSLQQKAKGKAKGKGKGRGRGMGQSKSLLPPW